MENPFGNTFGRNEEDGEIVYNRKKLYYIVIYDVVWVDDSFSHEWGIKKCGHDEIVDIEIIKLQDEDGNDVELNEEIYKIIEQDVLLTLY